MIIFEKISGVESEKLNLLSFREKADCCGCHACQTICPTECIHMETDNEGFLYPLKDTNGCNGCGLCKSVCPLNMELRKGDRPKAFAAWNRDESIRLKSSSGGVFNILMQWAFHRRGIVFGAAFDDKMALCHQSAQNNSEGNMFRGAKYLQSELGDTYIQVKDALSSGKITLFSGTPCQVAGLYAFLGKDHDCLLTCDLVCHGVPSPKVFAAYIAKMGSQYGANVDKISFRDKYRGWKKFSLHLLFGNGKEYRQDLYKDPFMIGFLRNKYLRPSCHYCRFSRIPRIADISLGDFWGVGKQHPEWDDDKGTSLVLVQTNKGQKVIDYCREEMVCHKADLGMAIKSNICIEGSVPPSSDRNAFFNDLNLLPFKKVMKRYMYPKTFKTKAVRKTKVIIENVLRKK